LCDWLLATIKVYIYLSLVSVSCSLWLLFTVSPSDGCTPNSVAVRLNLTRLLRIIATLQILLCSDDDFLRVECSRASRLTVASLHNLA